MSCLLGYSVFAVTQADPDAPLGLPRTEADAIASTLPEPSSASRANPQRPPAKRFGEPTSTDDFPEDLDLEDDDYELQAALQASLMNQNGESIIPPHLTTGMLRPSEFCLFFLVHHLVQDLDLVHACHLFNLNNLCRLIDLITPIWILLRPAWRETEFYFNG
jgi:hypothetical protein